MADLVCDGCGQTFVVASRDLPWLAEAIESFHDVHMMCGHPAATAVDNYLRHLQVIK